MPAPKITGIVLVRNEEFFVERAVGNASDFCDELLLCDHASTDRTPDLLLRLAGELPCASFHRLAHPRESHEMLRRFCGTDRWVFAVDGDEIYDPAGLARMRRRLLSGEFATSWQVFGNVLNVTSLPPGRLTATGHLAPPCRSMTKLYNFAAIENWEGNCPERLHGGAPMFRPGFAATDRRYLHEEVSWDESDFRCLHLCFIPRSPVDDGASQRRNIMETYGSGGLARMRLLLRHFIRRDSASKWKAERYRRGPEVTVEAGSFFPPAQLP